MCGISGLYNPSGLSGAEHGIDRMTSLLSHRGPDANGKYVSANCALGHARLSIIDLNDRSNQPMWSACGRYVMVYNGEVYNYGEIALQIYGDHKGGPGFKLKTSGDSEVVLEAFALYGPSFVQLLNGMFAIAIYDTQSEELFLFRDRLGIKPLFYYHKESSVVFASELKAIVANDFVEKKVLSSGLFEFMQLGFVPAPLTIYQDIYKLPGGCYLKAGHAGVEVIKYWDLESKVLPQTYTDPNEVTVRLSDLLTSSVQYQMRSDVPYGVFLSGGVDSSLITAQAVSLSSSRISTFSIGFAEKRYNESTYARSVAEYLGTDHHEFIVGYEDALALVENITDVYDEPFADSSCIPTMLVSKLARSKVTVALSGDGGDELFFGYGSHQWARRMGNPLARLMRYPVSMVFGHLSPRFKRVGELLDYPEGTNLMKHIFGQEQYLFSESSAHSLLSNEHRHQMGEELRTNRYTPPKFSYDYFENLLSSGGLKRRLNRMEMQAFYDVISYLQDDLLAKVDRASMKFSLEGRVPFLDHRIVEFAINIDPKMKYSDGVPKYILKEVLYHFLPEKIFDRPKQGFSIPLEKWLRNELSFLLDQYLSEDSVLNTGLFDWSAVKKIKDRFQKGDSWCYNRIWSLLMVQIWYYRNFKT